MRSAAFFCYVLAFRSKYMYSRTWCTVCVADGKKETYVFCTDSVAIDRARLCKYLNCKIFHTVVNSN
jgi:hypothetical protein